MVRTLTARRTITVLATVLFVAGAVWGGRTWLQQRQWQRQEARLATLAKGKTSREALVLALWMEHRAAELGRTQDAERLARVALDLAVTQRDLPRLLALGQRRLALLEENEEAALFVARAWMTSGREAEAVRLREAWRGRAVRPASWLCLESDALVRAGQADEALKLLKVASFPGTADAPRWLRLAMLQGNQPAEAARCLANAYAADPKNADVRALRAQLLERAGDMARARVEYVATVLAEPGNPVRRDDLADFYLRQRNPELAVAALRDAMESGALDYQWVKAAFWAAVVQPSLLPDPKAKPPEGRLASVYARMRHVPAGRFWDDAPLDGACESRPEVTWLRTLELLRQGDEAGALAAVDTFKPVERELAPELASVLRVILRVRATGDAPKAGDLLVAHGEQHVFVQRLKRWAEGTPDPELLTFVRGPHAFSGAALAAGWREAALKLAAAAGDAVSQPEWYVYGLVQVTRWNRDSAQALSLAERAPSSPLMRMMVGELKLASGQADAGRADLAAVAGDASDAGYRAAWLLATESLEQKRPDDALRWVRGQAKLSESVTGAELRARAALAKGDIAAAVGEYDRVSATSTEAQAWLARRAFAEKRWDEARRWTLSLMERLPDDMTLRANLAAITAAEEKR